MNNTPIQSPGSLIEKEEKGYQNNTPVQSPGSLIEKKEKGYQVEEKDKFDEEEDRSHHLQITSISDRESAFPSSFPQESEPMIVVAIDLSSPRESEPRFPWSRTVPWFHHRLAAREQTMHLLKHYSLLKEELNWPDIITIADNLYTDGYLQGLECLKIRNRSQPRRKAIDILLKVVLGNESSVSAFMKIMESKSTLSYIAERINMTQISAEEMERFRHLEGILQGQRQNIYQVPSQKIQSSDSDFSFLLHHSYEKDVIDQMGDFLLSNFFISISDHTGIVEQTHLDGKILTLIGLMKKCPDDVYDVLVEVLTKKNMQCVLECLERNQMPNMKRKHWSTGKIHQNALNRCLPVLVSDLDVTVVYTYIQRRGVLDDVTMRDILEQKTTSDKIRELIKQIQERDQVTYDKFKECLVQAKQAFLKVMLEEEEAKFAKEIEDHDMPTLQKRAKVEVSASDAVEKIARGLRIAPARQKLGNKANKHLDLELKESFWGSMGLMFSFKVGRPSQKLKQAFA